jgi:hypothetical protein
MILERILKNVGLKHYIYPMNLLLKVKLIFICIISIFRIELEAQDTLVLIDREPKFISAYRIENDQVYYLPFGKTKERIIEIDKLYSVRTSSKGEEILYKQDSLENNYLNVEQMADYIHGQQDARNGYGKQATKSGSGGFVFGFLGSATGIYYGPLFVIGYTAWKGASKPKYKKELGFDKKFVDNVFYKEGYGTMAKRLVSRRSAIGSGFGFLFGVATLSFVLQ